MDKFKIMFVCMGNICRSPLAHAIFKKMVEDEGLDKKFIIESSGTTGYHTGSPPDSRMTEVAESRGYEMDHKARRFMPHDLEDFDLVLAMDKSNYEDILRYPPEDGMRAEVRMFRDFDSAVFGSRDVPDPYFGGSAGFENVYTIVQRTCRDLLEYLKDKLDL